MKLTPRVSHCVCIPKRNCHPSSGLAITKPQWLVTCKRVTVERILAYVLSLSTTTPSKWQGQLRWRRNQGEMCLLTSNQKIQEMPSYLRWSLRSRSTPCWDKPQKPGQNQGVRATSQPARTVLGMFHCGALKPVMPCACPLECKRDQLSLWTKCYILHNAE